jgi:alcohol dehydrogenase class IV
MTLEPEPDLEEHAVAATVANDGFGLLRLPRHVVFGPGQRRAVPLLVREHGRTVLVCTDSRLAGDPVLTEMLEGLRAAGVEAHVFADTEPELPVACAERAVGVARGHRVDAVLGVGGGSCLDLAKVVALLLTHGGHPQDYYGEFAVPGALLPVVAVPTTAGTGSEVTPVAVLADPERQTKVGISSPHLIPYAAVVDPELAYTCPASLTAHAGADALTHLVEAYTAVRRPSSPGLAHERVFVGRSAFTDQVALAGLELMGAGLVTSYRHGARADARQQVMLGALYGGIAFGTAGTAAAHALQYPLGARTHTPHGLGVGALLPYVMRHNFPARVPEMARIATALGVADDGAPERERAHQGLLAVDAILDALDIPATLADLGLPAGDISWMAEAALGAQRLVENNPVPLDLAATVRIVTAAYEGDRSLPD